MESALKPRICIIGSGNVATHLAAALATQGEIVQIYSRDRQNAVRLAGKLGLSSDLATDSLKDITCEADFYLVSVKDDAVEEVAKNTPHNGVWAHTSGSVPMSVFAPYKERYGVFYPLQTFSREHEVDMKQVPIFVEGSAPAITDELLALGRKISDTVRIADSDLRKKLHVAAVFACNFVNLMWMEADELLCAEGLGIEFLKPLLVETLRKLDDMKPAEAQTGPARRGDRKIIGEHLGMLDGERRDLYAELSRIILKRYNHE